MKKVLVILGHPSSDSFNNALAEKYAEGARASGKDVRLLKLGELKFDPIMRFGFKQTQALEPDLLEAQESIKWADHLVFVFPTWWGTLPALLKGFIDRTLTPGYAFKYRPNSPWWDKFLTGRSARIITTMDSPAIYNWLMYRSANIRGLKVATLEFCGVRPIKVTTFDRLRFADEARRGKMLDQTFGLGQKD